MIFGYLTPRSFLNHTSLPLGKAFDIISYKCDMPNDNRLLVGRYSIPKSTSIKASKSKKDLVKRRSSICFKRKWKLVGIKWNNSQ